MIRDLLVNRREKVTGSRQACVVSPLNTSMRQSGNTEHSTEPISRENISRGRSTWTWANTTSLMTRQKQSRLLYHVTHQGHPRPPLRPPRSRPSSCPCPCPCSSCPSSRRSWGGTARPHPRRQERLLRRRRRCHHHHQQHHHLQYCHVESGSVGKCGRRRSRWLLSTGDHIPCPEVGLCTFWGKNIKTKVPKTSRRAHHTQPEPTFRGRDHWTRSGASLSEVLEEGVDLPQEQQVQDLGSFHHNLKKGNRVQYV